MSSVFWVSKTFDGFFFFMVFKVCQWIWDKLMFTSDDDEVEYEVLEDQAYPDLEAVEAQYGSSLVLLPLLYDIDDEDNGFMGWVV